MKPSNDIVAEYSELAAVGNRCLSHLLLSSTCRTRMRAATFVLHASSAAIGVAVHGGRLSAGHLG